MRQKTFKRGFRSNQDPRILDKYVENRSRLDRSKKITSKIERVLFKNVRTDRTDKKKLNEVLVYK